MLDHINRHRRCHIATIEDATHSNKLSAAPQRAGARGADALSFDRGVLSVPREDTEVVLAGEMRDPESSSMTPTIADTGHLVSATLHTNDSSQPFDRMDDIFPADRREQVQVPLLPVPKGQTSLRPAGSSLAGVGVAETSLEGEQPEAEAAPGGDLKPAPVDGSDPEHFKGELAAAPSKGLRHRLKYPGWSDTVVVEAILIGVWVTLAAVLGFFMSEQTTTISPRGLIAVVFAGLCGLLIGLLVVLRRASERNLRRTLNESASMLRSIKAVTDPALSFMLLDEVLEEVLSRTRRAVGGDVVSVMLLNDNNRTLKVRAAYGATALAPLGEEVNLGEGVLGVTTEWAGPVVIDDVPQHGHSWPTPTAANGLASLMAAPLLVRDRLIGLVEVGSRSYKSFSSNDLRLLEVVADRCADYIERARLGEAERRSRLAAEHARMHLNVLARAETVLAKALESYEDALVAFGQVVVPEFADWFCVDLPDDAGELRRVATRHVRGEVLPEDSSDATSHRHPDGDQLVRLAIAEQRCQVVVRAGASSFARFDASVHLSADSGSLPTAGVESMMIVPIQVNGLVAGAISFLTGTRRRGYRPSDLATALGLAERVEVAIDRVTSWRARVVAEHSAVRHAVRLQRLLEAVLVVNAPLAAGEVLELLCEHALGLLAAEVVVVSALPEDGFTEPSILAMRTPNEMHVIGRDSLDAVVLFAGSEVKRVAGACRRPDDDLPMEALLEDDGESLRARRPGSSALNSWIAIPMDHSGRRSDRVLVALGAPLGVFSEDDASVLTLLARIGAVALENAELYETVRGNEQRLEALVDSSPLAIAELDLEGNARWWNRAATELFGWQDGDGPCRVPVREGSELVMAGLWELARSGKPTVGVPMPSVSASRSNVELSVSTAPLTTQGRTTGLLLVADDVTERRRLLDQFHQAERLSAMSRMAGALAHDFNNLLTVILGCSDVLERRVVGQPALSEEVSAIKRAGQRAAALTSQLVGIGSDKPIHPDAIHIDEVIRTMVPLLSRLLGDSVELDVRMLAGPARILGDRAELERSILNLAINSKDAMPDGGRVVVRTGRVKSEVSADPTKVRISVSDTGTGMTPEVAAQCFEPFFTTKGRARGTGLGLATVQAAVTRAGGEVSLATGSGNGTKITLTFPEYRGQPPGRATSDEADERPESDPRRDGEVVLLVDDEPELLRLSARELESSGYVVLTAPNANQAMSLLQAHGGVVDILVSDVVMPGMNGIELADAVRRRYPRIPVLFVSGHVDEDAVGRRQLPVGAELLAKPFTPDQLVERVQRVIHLRPTH